MYEFKFRLNFKGMSVSDGACRCPMEYVSVRWSMSVSNRACWSPMEHVGLRWSMSVSDEACWSQMGHVDLKWGMSVSAKACRSPNSNNIFVNSSTRLHHNLPQIHTYLIDESWTPNFFQILQKYYWWSTKISLLNFIHDFIGILVPSEESISWGFRVDGSGSFGATGRCFL